MLYKLSTMSKLCKNPLIEIWYLFYRSFDKKLESSSCLLSELVGNESLKKKEVILLHVHIGWWAKAKAY